MIIIFLICHLLLNKLTYIIYLYLGNNYVFLIGQCQLTLEILKKLFRPICLKYVLCLQFLHILAFKRKQLMLS